ncbi:hypothetical protein PPACK8108_LOCUS18416 [Phakopsora pachyrhizi]|uniref:Uncharacterized protein n=1 Tax=Phakopsora pachyrhizi TaxID=170000 RepID=A0AAV0BC90_PHAPC|nr:hypothetical protein PPACK8108_LOCUS18416 [Phakopsora pachyrhizi]
MYSDNEQLYSSEGESEPPKKNYKYNNSYRNSTTGPLSGTSLQGRSLVSTPIQNKHTQEPNTSNWDFFVIPTSNRSHASVSIMDCHSNRPNLHLNNSNNQSSTKTSDLHKLTEQSENLGNNTFELLLQTLKAHLEVQSGHESFFRNISLLNTTAEKHAAIVYLLGNISRKMKIVIEAIAGSQITSNMDTQSNTSHTFLGSNNFVWTKPPKDYICIMLHQLFITPNVEFYTKGTDSDSRVIGNLLYALAMILKNILVQETNPEQPIPRLIELTKFNGLPPREHHIATKRYLAKKMASEIDISLVELPTDEQVEQELMKDSESLQQDDYTSDEQYTRKKVEGLASKSPPSNLV